MKSCVDLHNDLGDIISDMLYVRETKNKQEGL